MSHCRLRIAHARCLQFERSGMVLMSHIREASKVTVNSSYFHPAHQQYYFAALEKAHECDDPRTFKLSARNVTLQER
jgi:predicted transcriptional regulator